MLRWWFTLVLGAFSLLVFAAPAKHRVVVDLFSGNEFAYEAALGNVVNLRKAFGTEPLEVEIVCSGPGLDLLVIKNNRLRAKIEALHRKGVQFAACQNTMRIRQIGKERLFSFAKLVDAGVAELVRKQEDGWSYLRR